MRIAISTGGGDAPGLNAVIRAACLSAINRGWEVLGIKRGYHRHYHAKGNASLSRPIIDTENGYALTPMEQGIRLTTGAEFAVLPPQNASGNWVKVVQRVPVRIDFKPSGDLPLRSGMSAVVSVDTGKTTLDKMQNQ